MSSVQNLVEAIRVKLTADQAPGTLYDKLGGRIYYQNAKQNDPLPLLVYEVIEFSPLRHFGDKFTYTGRVRFVIYQKKETGGAATSGAGSLEEDLFALLDRFELTIAGQDRGLVLFTVRGVTTIEEDDIRVEGEALVRGTTTP